MPPESDPHFKAAFAELHRRRCAEAASFEAMRARAERAARPSAPLRVAWRFPLAASGVCLALLGLWHLQMTSERAASAQRVERLLASIDRQLELSADFTPTEFPTDILLTQIDPEPLP